MVRERVVRVMAILRRDLAEPPTLRKLDARPDAARFI